MPSLLPHDLCHGRSSSRWLPGSDRIPVELFQILKDDAVESAALNMQYAGSLHHFIIYKQVCIVSGAQLLSGVQLFAILWNIACQAPLSMNFPGRILEWVAVFSSRGSS